MADSRTFTARWIFPVASPPLFRGTIVIRGHVIESVDPHGVRTADEDLGNVALVPGLVNPHTHLDLSGARGLIPPTDPDHFTDWLRGVIAYRRSRTPEQVQADIRAGLAECMRFGTTLVGDIAAEGASWDAIVEAKIRGVVFKEWLGFSSSRLGDVKVDGTKWAQRYLELCRPGVSPHAPYSVSTAAVHTLGLLRVPLAIHWAESPAELDLIRAHAGPFKDFLQDLGLWETAEKELIPSHSSMTSWLGLKGNQVLFVHANYPFEDAIWRSNQSIVYCPRTHAAFRHPPHPFREFLKRGVRVCLGTDSLASNPGLDILAEARFVSAKYPEFPGQTLLKMITLSGSEALGWANETGSLEPGKSADFVAVPLPGDEAADPHELLFADHAGERRTLFRGAWRR